MLNSCAARTWILALTLALLSACQSTPKQRTESVGAPEIDMATTQRLAEETYGNGDWGNAEVHYVRLVQEFPQEAKLWFRLANIYARTDRPGLAVDAYRECLVREPDFGKAWFNMGVVQLRQAANSFHKMNVHVEGDDPVRENAARAYRQIQDILDDNGGAAKTTAVEPAAADTAPGEMTVAGTPPAVETAVVDIESPAPAADGTESLSGSATPSGNDHQVTDARDETP